ncbi:uncharacterized protein C19orf47 homolog [Tubulanus polymorphus]|uniref:uncharacterized protein C19orf47 homolog n=1 Tax=Tubulanus polymorphus TaxID=672921 RepID=UPI003DA66D33
MAVSSPGITTSQWIRFFTDSGIPASDAASYAIIFTDNRIQKDMLMDLNKEYLNDMGIKMMGDVIAILRHAKTVFSQDQRDKVLNAKTNSPSSTPRRSTPASRIIDHYIGKDNSASPLNEPPGSKLSKELAARLGPSERSSPVSSNQMKKRRSVQPDEDGTTVSVPSLDTTPSVFSRLGDEASPKITVAGVTSSSSPGSVFNRLGKAVKRPASSTSETAQLSYAGVLKQATVSPTKKPKINRAKLKITVASPAAEMRKTSTTPMVHTQGCLAMDSQALPVKLKDRLGAGKVIASATSTTELSKLKVTKVNTKVKNAQKQKDLKIVQQRKSQKTEVSSSDDVKSVFDRLGKKT